MGYGPENMKSVGERPAKTTDVTLQIGHKEFTVVSMLYLPGLWYTNSMLYHYYTALNDEAS